MCTSNSGLPFNQPSKSSTKWALVRYRPGTAGGGGGSGGHGKKPPHDRHSLEAGAPRHGGEGAGDEALERQLVLAERGAIELALDVSAERGVAEREGEGACQELGGRRRGEDARSIGRRVGCSARWAVGTCERAHQHRERRRA